MYITPQTRSGPYVAGIILGYILHVTKNKRFEIRMVIVPYFDYVLYMHVTLMITLFFRFIMLLDGLWHS